MNTSHPNSPPNPSVINQKIARFYDECTSVWERAWSEHIHQGYYGLEGNEEKDHLQAQLDLIEAMLSFAEIDTAEGDQMSLLDVGCGVGGTLYYLADRFQGALTGVTLSSSQAERAQELAAERGVSDRARVLVGDALDAQLSFAPHDVVMSIEVCEHVTDKATLFQRKFEATRPGGVMVMSTFCHRELEGSPLSDEERSLLMRFYKAYHLPYVESLSDYARHAEAAGYVEVRAADWTVATAPFLGAIMRSMIRPKTIRHIVTSGALMRQGAAGLRAVIKARDIGLLRFGALTARRPV